MLDNEGTRAHNLATLGARRALFRKIEPAVKIELVVTGHHGGADSRCYVNAGHCVLHGAGGAWIPLA